MQLAYVAAGQDGNLDLFLADADGRRITPLTQTSDDELYPAWSPDGTMLAYVRAALRSIDSGRTSPGAGLYAIELDKGARSEARLLASAEEAGLGIPTWSPDGKRVAYISPVYPGREGGPMAMLLNLITVATGVRETVPLTPTIAGMSSAVEWSPDGSAVAFVATRGTVDVMGLAAGRQPVLPPGAAFAAYVYDLRARALRMVLPEAQELAWSPTGEWLACRDSSPGTAMTLVRPDGSGQRPLIEEGYAMEMAWSPDGSRLALTVDTGHDETELMIFSIEDGTAVTFPVEPGLGGPFFIAWSPDGNYISYTAFTAEGEILPEGNLCIMDAKTGAVSLFPDSPGMEGLAVWRPIPTPDESARN